jgi:antitoxin VapB
MAILIKDKEAEAAVRKLAAATGRTLTETVKLSVQKELEALKPARKQIDHAALDALLKRIHAYPRTNEHLTDDEIVGYDENGLPT